MATRKQKAAQFKTAKAYAKQAKAKKSAAKGKGGSKGD